MLLLSNRIKFCSLAFTAARLYSSGPAAANKNPLVYFDIAADKEPLGRVTFEVSRLKISVDTACISLHVNVSVCMSSHSRWFTLPRFKNLKKMPSGCFFFFCSSTQKSCPKLQVSDVLFLLKHQTSWNEYLIYSDLKKRWWCTWTWLSLTWHTKCVCESTGCHFDYVRTVFFDFLPKLAYLVCKSEETF